MLTKFVKLILGTLVMLIFSVSVHAEGKISGIIFGDYYVVAQHHSDELEGRNGFWIRRIYFTYDNEISEKLKVRLRMEYNQNGDFKTKGKMTPYVKDAFLQWKAAEGNLFIVGISAPPTYELIEEMWGYRDLEKTSLDLHKIRDSRDFGLAYKGKKDKLDYHLFFGNGSGTDVELDKGKAVYGAISYEFHKKIFIQAYADYYYRSEEDKSYVLQLFIAHKRDSFRIGAHYSHCVFEGIKKYEIDLASIFTVIKINERSDFIVRYDAFFDPNPKGESIAYIPFSGTGESNLIIVGISYSPHKSVRIIPNIKYVYYGDNDGDDIKSDLYANLTFSYKF